MVILICINDKFLKDYINSEYRNNVSSSDIIKTENNNLFRYNYICKLLLCINSAGGILAQKFLDTTKWLHNPYKEVILWEAELVSW